MCGQVSHLELVKASATIQVVFGWYTVRVTNIGIAGTRNPAPKYEDPVQIAEATLVRQTTVALVKCCCCSVQRPQ